MSRSRFVMLFAAAVIVIGIALFATHHRNQSQGVELGGALLPGLAQKLDAVSTLGIRKGGAAASVTLQKADGQWTVAERADYPADAAKVRKLLLALADAKIVEEKTSDPANFAVIGVDDPGLPKATGAEVTLTAKDAKLAAIIGKAAGEGNFARRPAENQSYLIAPGVTLEAAPQTWIDPRLIDAQVKSIQRIEFKPASGPGYTLHRLKPEDPGFNFDGTPPAGRKLLDAAALAPSPSIFSGLTAEDVASAKDIDFSNSVLATITFADGNVITLTGTALADKHWIQLTPSKDDALLAKTKGRAFEVAAYRYDAIFQPLEKLLVPKEVPAAKGPANGPANGAAKGPAKASPAPAT
jgi:hypothetical protein